MTPSKLSAFDRFDFDFKVVHGKTLKASILVPKKLQSKPREAYPALINWHGGGFIIGERLYEGWIPVWLLDLCLQQSAIFIAPDYRLLPEATGNDLLEDVEHFWHWLHYTLPTLTATWNAIPDLSNLACTGQSAGGYLAVQSALCFPKLSQLKFVSSMGGGLNTHVQSCRIPQPRLILGKRPPPPAKAESIIRNYVRNMKPQTVRTSGDVIEMWDFLTCVLQQAYLARWLGLKGQARLDIMNMLDEAETMPPMWLIHGEQDSVVPTACTTGFADKVKHTLPDVPILLSVQPGDHGFEAMHDGKEQWIQDGIKFIGKYWP